MAKDLADQLIAKEMAIVAAQKRRDLVAVEAALADGFREIGSSGRMFSKADVLDAIRKFQIVDYWCEDFQCLPVNPKCVILMYIATVTRIHEGQEQSHRAYRSSTWVERDGAWRVIFHQASVLPRLERGG